MYLKLFFAIIICFGPVSAADKPNILWIVSEDNDSQWLGCYGNKQAQTPNIDHLAKHGVLFNHAYSNAPVCAVARSTILNGAYAISQGTQHMRSRHRIPAKYKSYVGYLKDEGYYCTNRSKTDYNFEGNDKAIWDSCSKSAHYDSRPDGVPFFTIFNLTVSHESSLFSDRIARNRRKGLIPKTSRITPENVTLPPYLPDLPAIRSDLAIYHDNITALDAEIGKILAELKAKGLSENTIVFYYSDHGGVTPRGKRYLKNTGVKVPLIVHIPEKWQALSPHTAGQRVDEVVSFVDLAPTLLSLLGIDKPQQMQGRAFLGSKRTAAPDEHYALLYADRFDELYGMRRGITDGRWKYIHRFTPHLTAAPYSFYQFGQAGWKAWQAAWEKDNLADRYKKIWEPDQVIEELFDTNADPWEIKNLAADPAHRHQLTKMRGQLRSSMINARDTGLVPEPMFKILGGNATIANYMESQHAMLPELVDLALMASERDIKNLDQLIKLTESEHPLKRYWAAQGLLILHNSVATAEKPLTKLLNDPFSAIRVAAAHTLFLIGNQERGRVALIDELNKGGNEYNQQNVINALRSIGALDEISQNWVDKTLADPKAGKYVERLAAQLKSSRQQKK